MKIEQLSLGPDARGFPGGVEFDVDEVGVAADGAVFDVLLVGALRGVEGDDDGFAAGGAGVGGLIITGGF